ncbi:MAG: long-chain fatty acid--CoA ligase [bacterium]|nr:long-chain fatty acid--CoA ligase [bacterium]
MENNKANTNKNTNNNDDNAAIDDTSNDAGSENSVDNKNEPKTLNDFLNWVVEKHRDRPALATALKESMSFGDMKEKVIKVADMLIEKGIQKGNKVALLGANSPNWGISYFAIVRTGAVAVPILADFPESDIRHILLNSEAKILFTTEKQLDKIGDLNNTKLKNIITLDDFQTETQTLHIEPISAIIDKSIDFIKKIPESIGLKSKVIKEDDVASIIYTSGTSGHSKAVMLTHKNLVSNALACSKLADIQPEWTFLSVLPLAHTYEFTVGFLLMLLKGSKIVYLGKAPTPSILEKVCKVEKPGGIISVPLIMEKIYKKKVQPVLEKNTMVKIMTKIPGLRNKIYKKIGKKLIDFFGGQLQIMAIGGAPFNKDAEKFFKAAEFPYLVGYGLTETAPLLAGGPFKEKTLRISAVGKVTPGCEIKIVEPDPKSGIGEIYGRGPNVMKGYYKNPELTSEVIDAEGWFKTGDLGRFDKYDNLYITGRSKSMILMSNGENIYPESIEEKLNASIYTSESLVIENNNLLEAWIYLDYDLIDQETKGKSEKQKLAFIEKLLQNLKQEVNGQLSSFSKISKIVEHEEPFTKTVTHKIKRYLYSHK